MPENKLQEFLDIYMAIETLKKHWYLTDDEYNKKINMYARSVTSHIALFLGPKKEKKEEDNEVSNETVG